MTEKVAPCTYDMAGKPVTNTCPRCLHSGFVHMVEADGCVLCHVDSTRDDIAVMLEEMRGIMSEFLQTARSNAPRAATGTGKLKRGKHRHDPA